MLPVLLATRRRRRRTIVRCIVVHCAAETTMVPVTTVVSVVTVFTVVTVFVEPIVTPLLPPPLRALPS